MPGSPALLDVTALSCGFMGHAVCGEVTVTIASGEVLGIVGWNGAGKSTVLRTVAGRQDALSGSVRFRGEPRQEESARWRRAVSAVFDDDAWFPGLTVREHLHLVAAGHGLAAPDRSVDQELAFFGLEAAAKAFPETLSSGQRRRLLLAAAFLRPADLMLLDEPEQRLDPAMVARLGERIVAAADEGMAAVVVTHDPQFLTRVAGRCLVIDDDVDELTPARAAALITGRPAE
ncbi:ABC transporter ATP-binding protein [Kocuria coralli]|uniref:ABC transporter ATP-binding protein n=1 Tax=Kocuria coralli TaxID=1461025 RepID=A0A5J5L0K8_9MICC|nr:ABC transporter ATP-binding protein [Kocuria coralli]KAA9394461.1 ABC transporter ATP-binding protein [Kocuria coralli]